MLACIRTAHAYIDPSSMTYLIQIIAGAAIAIGAGLGFYWKRISRWLNKRKNRSDSDHKAAVTPESVPEDEVYDPTVFVEEKKEDQQE